MTEIRCMEPVSVPEVVTGGDFIHQVKWDGIRGITFIENGQTSIYTKKGYECTAAYPEFKELHRQINANQAVLDGEMAAFINGKPSFYHVLRRSLTRSEAGVKRIAAQYPVKYLLFDILFLNGEDLRNKPLIERQQILSLHFSNSAAAAAVDSFEDGEALFSLMKQRNMEGIVSKKMQSRYIVGKKHNEWFKTKISKKLLCVVMGIQLKNSLPASLALGVYREGELVSVGGASSGLDQGDWAQLVEFMHKEKISEQKDIVWIRPVLTCWVRFAEWTEHGTLRHPVLLGFSDRDAREAAGEELSF